MSNASHPLPSNGSSPTEAALTSALLDFADREAEALDTVPTGRPVQEPAGTLVRPATPIASLLDLCEQVKSRIGTDRVVVTIKLDRIGLCTIADYLTEEQRIDDWFHQVHTRIGTTGGSSVFDVDMYGTTDFVEAGPCSSTSSTARPGWRPRRDLHPGDLRRADQPVRPRPLHRHVPRRSLR
ncbi:hypothetical protein [Gordonia sp. FQ]|uniref:hypothetical protein n=1 Tax=Gordonia sp. FQ TaxID=3446634 RepID=UPI003F8243EE